MAVCLLAFAQVNNNNLSTALGATPFGSIPGLLQTINAALNGLGASAVVVDATAYSATAPIPKGEGCGNGTVVPLSNDAAGQMEAATCAAPIGAVISYCPPGGGPYNLTSDPYQNPSTGFINTKPVTLQMCAGVWNQTAPITPYAGGGLLGANPGSITNLSNQTELLWTGSTTELGYAIDYGLSHTFEQVCMGAAGINQTIPPDLRALTLSNTSGTATLTTKFSLGISDGSTQYAYITGTTNYNGTYLLTYHSAGPNYTFPFSFSGTVNTVAAGNVVSWVSGPKFGPNWAGLPITINSVVYTIAAVGSNTTLSLTTSPGTQTGVSWSETSIASEAPTSASVVPSDSCFDSGSFTHNMPGIVVQRITTNGQNAQNVSGFHANLAEENSYAAESASLFNANDAGIYGTITNASSLAGVATIVTSTSLTARVGMFLTVTNTTNYNGTFQLTSANNATDTYKFTLGSSPATETSGNAQSGGDTHGIAVGEPGGANVAENTGPWYANQIYTGQGCTATAIPLIIYDSQTQFTGHTTINNIGNGAHCQQSGGQALTLIAAEINCSGNCGVEYLHTQNDVTALEVGGQAPSSTSTSQGILIKSLQGDSTTGTLFHVSSNFNSYGTIESGFCQGTCVTATMQDDQTGYTLAANGKLNFYSFTPSSGPGLFGSAGPFTGLSTISAAQGLINQGNVIDDQTAGANPSAMSGQTSATCTNVTGMTWNIAANKNYVLRCKVPRTLAASATIAYCLGGPGTATSYSLEADGALGAAGVWGQISTLGQTAWGTKTSASAAAGNTGVDDVSAFIQNGSTGSGTALTLQTAANGTNNILVGANAACTLTQTN